MVSEYDNKENDKTSMVTDNEQKMEHGQEDYAYKLTRSYGRIRKGERQIMERMSIDLEIEQNERNYENEISEFEKWAEMQSQTIDSSDEIALEQIIQHSIERLKRRLKQLIKFKKELEQEMGCSYTRSANIRETDATTKNSRRGTSWKIVLITISAVLIIIVSRLKSSGKIGKFVFKTFARSNTGTADIKATLMIILIAIIGVLVINLV